MSLRGSSVPSLSIPGAWMLPLKGGLWVYSSAHPSVFPGLLIWKPLQSCSCWSVCPWCSLHCPALLCPSHLTCLFHVHLYLYLSRDCEILEPAQPVGTRPGICSMAVKARCQGQRVNGIRGALLQAGCQTPCVTPALVLFLCPFSLETPQDREKWSGHSLE